MAAPTELSDAQLLRYSRHILLDELGIEGQSQLVGSHALVIGAGGLGSPVALYLASAGVGRITLVDDDVVDATNLQRQIAHTTDRVGQLKVLSAQAAMHALNPDVQVHPIALRATPALLAAWVSTADVVLDCTDNFETRHAINVACVAHGVPLVSGAAIRFDGQISVYDTRQPDAPCYACLFPPTEPVEAAHCATMGVFAPLVGIVGTIQAAEALKLLCGMPSRLVGRLQMLDGRGMDFQEIRLARNPDCPVCARRGSGVVG